MNEGDGANVDGDNADGVVFTMGSRAEEPCSRATLSSIRSRSRSSWEPCWVCKGSRRSSKSHPKVGHTRGKTETICATRPNGREANRRQSIRGTEATCPCDAKSTELRRSWDEGQFQRRPNRLNDGSLVRCGHKTVPLEQTGHTFDPA